jgi:hypothetical protein
MGEFAFSASARSTVLVSRVVGTYSSPVAGLDPVNHMKQMEMHHAQRYL